MRKQSKFKIDNRNININIDLLFSYSSDSDKDMLSKPSIKETDIVVDFIDTGVGEIEK